MAVVVNAMERSKDSSSFEPIMIGSSIIDELVESDIHFELDESDLD